MLPDYFKGLLSRSEMDAKISEFEGGWDGGDKKMKEKKINSLRMYNLTIFSLSSRNAMVALGVSRCQGSLNNLYNISQLFLMKRAAEEKSIYNLTGRN